MANHLVLELPTPFLFEGTRYLVHPRTFRIEAEFSAWLAGRARQAIEDSKNVLGDELVNQQMRQWASDVDDDLFEFGKQLSLEALAGVSGRKELARLQLRTASGQPVPAALVGRIFADQVRVSELQTLMFGPGTEGGGGSGEGPPFATICALLASEPYQLTMTEIAQLTRRQVARVYFHPRNKDGSIEVDRREGKQVGYLGQLQTIFRNRGWPEHRIQERLMELRREEAAKVQRAHQKAARPQRKETQKRGKNG